MTSPIHRIATMVALVSTAVIVTPESNHHTPQPRPVPPTPEPPPRPAPKVRQPVPPPPHDMAWFQSAEREMNSLIEKYPSTMGTRRGRAILRQIRRIEEAISKAAKENQ